ncbi:MAG: helix-turn-helix domain-containing protein [Desulfobacterales bacterium]|nr:helix-turn-helix domain-containing protein [Desulfobacterales bacterium]
MSAADSHITTGIAELDQRLGGLAIGDNVIWFDAAGSLAPPFAARFIEASLAQGKALIYVSFDRSPRALIQDLGPLADSPHLTILDCFTEGKGEGSTLFRQFYPEEGKRRKCSVINVDAPDDPANVVQAVYTVHRTLQDDVRLVFESLTGMQELWGSEAQVLRFYSRACPRLYELNTIAYWIIEREAHSVRLRANISKIAQVVMDLTLKRGKSTLTIVKAQGRKPGQLNKPVLFWSDDDTVRFENDQQALGKLNLSARLKSLRQARGMSQKELARGIGVTPSTISQIEGHLIYPSLSALVKMAEILAVDVNAFFQEQAGDPRPAVFSGKGWVTASDRPHEEITVRSLLPTAFDVASEVYLVEIQGSAVIEHHFWVHKGEEIGYLLSGRLEVSIRDRIHALVPGDLVYLTADTPGSWQNPAPETARLLWLKLKPYQTSP